MAVVLSVCLCIQSSVYMRAIFFCYFFLKGAFWFDEEWNCYVGCEQCMTVVRRVVANNTGAWIRLCLWLCVCLCIQFSVYTHAIFGSAIFLEGAFWFDEEWNCYVGYEQRMTVVRRVVANNTGALTQLLLWLFLYL